MDIDFEVGISAREVGDSKTIWDIKSDQGGAQTLEQFFDFTRSALVTIALDVLKEEQLKGFDKDPIQVVDGKKNKPLHLVHPLGKIQFLTKNLPGKEVVEDIYNRILERSPSVTGSYSDAHFVYYNGKLVARSLSELQTFSKGFIPKNGDTIRFVNVVPYARSLERKGVTKQRTKRVKVKSKDRQMRSGTHVLRANGVYFLASRSASRKYKHNLGVYFAFIRGSSVPNDGWPVSGRDGRPFRRTFKNAARPKDRGPYLYPSIKLVFGSEGVI